MGTSTSSRGPGSNTPLVPPWADTDGQGPGPTPPPQRFKEFRKSLGKFVSNGDRAELQNAVGRYAKSATGGSTVGPRRFGAMAHAGGALFDVLANLRDGISPVGLNLARLDGIDTDLAIEAIVQALVPSNGDADRIRAAMNEALSECLQGYDDFDFSRITDEMLIEVMLVYVRQCVFQQIVLDSRDALGKAEESGRIEEAERELLALVGAATETHMRPLLSGDMRVIDSTQIEQAQLQAIRDIWIEWEEYVA